MSFNLSALNDMFGTSNSSILSNEGTEFKGSSFLKSRYGINSFIKCKHGNIIYITDSDSSYYQLKLGNEGLEVDVEYERDYINGYSLKLSLFKDGAMVAYRSDICNELSRGISRNCEKIIDNYLKKEVKDEISMLH